MVADDRSNHRVLLIHGGLADDMNSDRFWIRPGIVAALETRGWSVLAPDRSTTPMSWSLAAEETARGLDAPSDVVAGSNGVSVALRLAIGWPELVQRMVLLWPATARDPLVDVRMPASATHLLDGETIRGVTDVELADIAVPCAVMAASPEDQFHRHHTVERLVSLLPGGWRIERALPESPRPEFGDHLGDFTTAVTEHLTKPVNELR